MVPLRTEGPVCRYFSRRRGLRSGLRRATLGARTAPTLSGGARSARKRPRPAPSGVPLGGWEGTDRADGAQRDGLMVPLSAEDAALQALFAPIGAPIRAPSRHHRRPSGAHLNEGADEAGSDPGRPPPESHWAAGNRPLFLASPAGTGRNGRRCRDRQSGGHGRFLWARTIASMP